MSSKLTHRSTILSTSTSMTSVETQMNVAALRRVDPYVKHILNTASQVALYQYNTEWVKTDVEGALFVCERNGKPYQNIIIMNRLNMNNLIEPVTKDLDVQLNVPFLLYKNNQSKIYGIWFYDKEECQQIANQLLEIVESNRKHSTTSADSSLKVNTISKSNDIFRLLNNAQQSGSKNSALTSQSVKEFFEKASSSTSNSKANNSNFQSPRILSNKQEKRILSPLVQNVVDLPIHSVEHIEKQQQTARSAQTKMNAEPLSSLLTSSEHNMNNNITKNSSKSSLTINKSLNKSKNGKNSKNHLNDEDTSPLLLNNDYGRPLLMTPTMFLNDDNVPNNFNNNNLNDHDELSNSSDQSDSILKVEPLTVKQFQQAFVDLLQNDQEFLKKLHESYYKLFTNLIS